MPRPDRILLFTQATAFVKARSGVHRVAVELARALHHKVAIDLVGWDEIGGQLTYLDAAAVANFFQGDVPPDLRPRLEAHRVNGRFGDTILGDAPVMMFPEISYHTANGTERFARAITQCREYGIPTAAIYYDAIPVTNTDYAEYRQSHIDYLVELSRVDQIFPISETSSKELVKILQPADMQSEDRANFEHRLHPVLLPEGAARQGTEETIRDTILMVGTIEPRKQQVVVLEAINELSAMNPALAALNVSIVGSLHPAVAARFKAAVANNPRATYHKYIGDSEIETLYRNAAFTVFASRDEGYGLPIAESLVRGIPCLTANYGSMQEVAQGGGCLTVDCTKPDALGAGLVRMATDDALRAKLHTEIKARQFRTWADYGDDILDGLTQRPDLRASVPSAQPPSGAVQFASRALGAFGLPSDDPLVWKNGVPTGSPSRQVVAAIVSHSAGTIADMSPDQRHGIYSSDIAAFTSDAAYVACLELCKADAYAGLMPPEIIVEPRQKALLKATETALADVALAKSRRLKFAAEETRYMALKRHFSGQGAQPTRILSLVISTFNRSPFVTMNARWLAKQVARFEGKVDLTVVDNASTDDSWRALKSLAGKPHVRLIQNPANTGMLGNLHVCSTLELARHVWVTGDDDFIKADALDKLVALLEREPGLPLAFSNFAVYHRAELGKRDTPISLQNKGTPMGTDPAPDGLRAVKDIASEHDNLFTAVYPIIFRSDILAACFNYPFTGTPFMDLVESVPTSKIILESYGLCPAFWNGDIGTVGNAHNSWSRHRPRWHALLMPRVFEAARNAGVDASRLRQWADVHLDLYNEALDIARDQAFEVHLEQPHDLRPGIRVFRHLFSVPDDLLLWQDANMALWDGK